MGELNGIQELTREGTDIVLSGKWKFYIQEHSQPGIASAYAVLMSER